MNLNVFLPLLVSIALIFAAAGIGRLLSRAWRSSDEAVVDSLVLDAALGLGAISLLYYVLCAFQLLSTVIVLAAFGICVLLGLFGLRRLFAKHKSSGSPKRANIALAGLAASALLAVLAISALVPALAPASMGDWDSLAYHLSVPKMYLRHGGFYYIPFTSHSNFPFLVEMLYLPGLAMNSLAAAKLVHFWMGILMVASVAMLVRKHFNAKAAPLAAIAIAGMPIVLWEATTAYIDLATALYTVVCAYLILRYFDTDNRAYLVGCGISAGFAASTKMTGLALIPILMIWLIADKLFSGRMRVEWRGALLLGGAGLLVCSPWYLKSLIYTGNPVYPFFYSVFGGRNWTADLARTYAGLQAKFGMGHGLVAFLRLPYDLMMHSEAFYDRPGLFVGPLFIISIPLLFLGKYRDRKLVGLIGFFAGLLIAWFGLSLQSRYLIPAFAVLAVISSAVVCADEKYRLAKLIFATAAVGTALFGICTLGPLISSTVPFVYGQESQDEYLTRAVDVYPAEKYINEELPSNAKIAIYGDTRGFFLNRNYVWADPGHNVMFTRNFSSADDLVSYLKRRGITHVMINHHFFPQEKEAKGAAERVYQAIDEGRLEEVYPSGYESLGPAVYKVE